MFVTEIDLMVKPFILNLKYVFLNKNERING